MMEGDLLEVLFAHDRWASGQMLEACGGLSDEQFHRRFEMGPGSLHDAMAHVLGAMRAWTESLGGWEARPRPDQDGVRRTAGELREMFEQAWGEFAGEARRRPLGEKIVRRLRDGRTIEMTRGAVVAQVTTHGMHHRAQCLNMLRQLGVTPLPPSGVAEWVMITGEGRE